SRLVSAGIASNLANNVTCEAGTSDYTLAFGSAGGAYTLTVPAVGGNRTFAFINQAQTWSANQTIPDSNLLIVDNVDATKILAFECSGITTGTTRTVTIPDASGTMTLLGNAATGSGSVVLATSPVLGTPTIGVATATTVNKVTLTAPASGSTLTIADGKTLTSSSTLTLAGTDGKTLTISHSLTLAGADAKTINFGANSITITTAGDANITVPTSGTLATLAGSETLTGKTLTTPTINGGKQTYASKSASYTLVATDYCIDFSGLSGGVTASLPTAAGITGTVYVIKNSDAAQTVTIDGNGAETIDGAATVALSAQYQFRMIISDGTNWKVIGS
ncbi:MAG: hypothetical protein QME51_10960, partial [Planctomycetota bacterium]|nr:hypothetical protein [Planctomycetota bacterium]